MQPLTFSSVKQLLARSNDSKLIDAADGLMAAILVLGPTVVGMSPAVVLAGLGLIGAKNELVKMGKSVYKWLTKPKDESESIGRVGWLPLSV